MLLQNLRYLCGNITLDPYQGRLRMACLHMACYKFYVFTCLLKNASRANERINPIDLKQKLQKLLLPLNVTRIFTLQFILQCIANFCRSFNAIYGRLGRCACTFIVGEMCAILAMRSGLLYHKRQSTTLTCAPSHYFSTHFKTNSIDIASYCKSAFGFQSVREQELRRKFNFLVKRSQRQDSLCSCKYANFVAGETIIAARAAQSVSANLNINNCIFGLVILTAQVYAYLKL